MTPELAFAALAFSSLLAIVNPLAAATIFLGLTAEYEPARRNRAVLTSFLTSLAVLVGFALLGRSLLDFFGISTHAFKIAGGIIFFGIGWDMLQAKRSRVKATEEEEEEGAQKEDIGMIPLGLPTIAGPGAMTTVIVLVSQAEGFGAHLALYGSIFAVLAITAGILLIAPLMLRTLGQTGLNVITRVMGLLVMVIGVQFVLDGLGVALQLIFPGGV